MLQAPTLKIAALFQESIVDWLESVGKWFLATWTGEHGNYTNPSAGYVGTADAKGPESRWRYLTRIPLVRQGPTCACHSLSLFRRSMDVRCLMLAYVENSQANHTLWDRAMDAISGMGEEKTPVTKKIRMWHEAGNRIGIALSATQGIIVPTEHLIKHLERKGYKQLNELMGAIEPLWAQYNLLFIYTDNFMEENPGMQPDGILNTMEAFVR